MSFFPSSCFLFKQKDLFAMSTKFVKSSQDLSGQNFSAVANFAASTLDESHSCLMCAEIIREKLSIEIQHKYLQNDVANRTFSLLLEP